MYPIVTRKGLAACCDKKKRTFHLNGIDFRDEAKQAQLKTEVIRVAPPIDVSPAKRRPVSTSRPCLLAADTVGARNEPEGSALGRFRTYSWNSKGPGRVVDMASRKSKVSPRLAAEAAAKGPYEHIDVVIGLRTPKTPERKETSRAVKIAAMKSAFDKDVEPVLKHVSSVGGEVIATAWINSTVRGRVPANRLSEIADDENVEIVDLQPALQLEK